jgi:hypothetical protein
MFVKGNKMITFALTFQTTFGKTKDDYLIGV